MEKEIVIDEHIRLRATTAASAAEEYFLIIRSREHILPWLSWVHIYDAFTSFEDGVRARQEYQAGKLEEFEKGTSYAYDIYYDNELAGCIELKTISHENRSCDIAYWLSKDFTGKGIMTKSVNILAALAFENLDMHRISINVADKNLASRSVAERCGFKLDAVLRDRFFLEGVYYGCCVYSKLESEI